jgi:hypothetical protein
MTEYVIATGLGVFRATVDDNNKVTDSTGGMITGLTLKQVRTMVVSHKWELLKVGDEDAKENEAEAEAEEHAHHQKKRGGR